MGTVTGLALSDVQPLERAQKLALFDWHLAHGGSNDGRLWLPGRIRRMPLAERMALAADPAKSAMFDERERRRVAASLRYFVTEYGAVQPEEGPPIPFDLWAEQEDVLAALMESTRVLILKARQLGLTWLALHEALWLMAFNPATTNLKVLALSKTGEDAKKLMGRARKLNDLLPPYLRQTEHRDSRESKTNWKLKGRGSELIALMSTPQAAHSETAGMVIADEFSYTRNRGGGEVLKAVLPTLGQRGRLRVIFTGNGRVGDGAAAAELWERDDTIWRRIFLPRSVDPRRTDEWADATRREFLTDEDFLAQYPTTPEEALAGQGSFHVYPHDGIAAAVQIGRDLEPILADLAEIDGYEVGTDWGDFQTFTLYGIPLGGGGMYVIDELMQAHTEPGEASENIVYRDPAKLPGLTLTATYADSNPAGSNRTFGRVLREAHLADPWRYPDEHHPVVFSTMKEGGGDRAGVNTVGYIKHLLDRAKAFDGEPREAHGLLAIHPRCTMLIAQLRNLERDADTGKVRKPALDPRQIERGDHGPDGLVALMSTRAARFRAEVAA